MGAARARAGDGVVGQGIGPVFRFGGAADEGRGASDGHGDGWGGRRALSAEGGRRWLRRRGASRGAYGQRARLDVRALRGA